MNGVSSKEMGGNLFHHCWRRLAKVGVALYAVFLLTAPFEHHDLVCHLKTPRHCTVCAAQVLGSDPQCPASVGAAELADAGFAVAAHQAADGILLSVHSTGRSPPLSL